MCDFHTNAINSLKILSNAKLPYFYKKEMKSIVPWEAVNSFTGYKLL